MEIVDFKYENSSLVPDSFIIILGGVKNGFRFDDGNQAMKTVALLCQLWRGRLLLVITLY